MKQEKEQRPHVFLGGVFRPDGMVAGTLDVFSDMVILNILFLISCIPVFTVGASVCALTTCSAKIRKGEGSGVFRSYLSAFKRAFVRATPAWLFLAAILLVLFVEYPITRVMPDAAGTLFRGVLTVLFLLWLVEMIYLFPMLFVCEGGRMRCARLALITAFFHLPKTLLMMAITALPLIITLFASGGAAVVLLVMLLIGPAAIAQVNSILREKILLSGVMKRE